MSTDPQRGRIVAYDIRCDSRRGRVHRLLKRHGIPIQYSVFLLHCDNTGFGRILREIERLIDPREDDVRGYTLPRKIEIMTYGRQGFGDGVFLLGANPLDDLQKL